MPDFTTGTNNAFSSAECDMSLEMQTLSANEPHLSASNDSVYTSIDNSTEMDALELDSESLLNYDQTTMTDSTSLSKNMPLCDEEYNLLTGTMKNKRTNSYENFVLIEQNQNSMLDLKNSIVKAVSIQDYNNRHNFKVNDTCNNQQEFVILNVMNIKKARNDEKSYL